MSHRFIFALAVTTVLAMAGCSSSNDSTCTFSYSQQVNGNISTILWPVGAARANANDAYAPDFRWHKNDTTLDSLSGHLGQAVLLNFWATWCGPCKAEMPAIQAAQDEMGDSLFVIGVAVDQCSPYQAVSDYIHSNGIRYQIAVDSLSRLYEQYWLWQPLEIPVSYFIGRDGQIKSIGVGQGDEAAILASARRAAQ